MLRSLWRVISEALANLMCRIGVSESRSGQGAEMDEKQPVAMNVSRASDSAGSPREGSRPELGPDGAHVYPVADVSVPARGVSGGTGKVTWHPERGLRFRIEAVSCTEAVQAQLNRPSVSSCGAGSIIEPSHDPELIAHVVGTGEMIRMYQLEASENRQLQFGTAGTSAKTVVSGTAVAATVRIERDSELSFWHETQGPCRLLIPDVCIYQWPTQEDAKWTSGDTHHSSMRSSCPLSDAPKLTLFSANALPQKRRACWLLFETARIPDGDHDWYTSDECLAAKSLLSFLCGKGLPFLWTDRFLDATHVTRTYHGTATVDDFPQATLAYQPAPLHSLVHGGAVVESLPSLFAAYLTMREWFDLDWIVGPLWYTIKAYLDDHLGLASVSLERFATAHDAFLEANPNQKRPKVKFLTSQQSKLLRRELSDSVDAFAKEKGIDLTTSRSTAVAAIIDIAIDSIARLDDSLIPAEAVEDLRSRMREAVGRANKSGKIKLDETKAKIIDRRIDSFAEKSNPGKLTETLEFDGLSLSYSEQQAVMKRNDCLHGRRTLEDAENLDDIRVEVVRFDTLRTLINKAVLARLGYRGPYVDYAARPTSGPFPIRNLADELTSEGRGDCCAGFPAPNASDKRSQ